METAQCPGGLDAISARPSAMDKNASFGVASSERSEAKVNSLPEKAIILVTWIKLNEFKLHGNADY